MVKGSWNSEGILVPSTNCESEGNSTNCAITHVLCSKGYSENLSLNTQLNAFWELEALGIQEEEKTVYDEYTTAIHFENGRYKIPLPWKEFHEPLPSHYDLSLRRLQSLLRQLMRKPAILKEYSATIAEQQKLGIIELVSKEEPTPKFLLFCNCGTILLKYGWLSHELPEQALKSSKT